MNGPLQDPVGWINAGSTVVMAVATIVLTVFAGLQIRHRAEDRRDQQKQLEAVAKFHGLHLRRALREAVDALDGLRLHDRTLSSWRQQATSVFNFMVEATRRLEHMAEALMERHAGTPAAIEEMLHATLAAFDAARELAGPAAMSYSDDEITKLYATARKQALVGLNRLEVELHLPPMPPQFQATGAPGALTPAQGRPNN